MDSLRGLHAGPPTHRYAQVLRVSPAWGKVTLTRTPVHLPFCSGTITGSFGEEEMVFEPYPLCLSLPPFLRLGAASVLLSRTFAGLG